MPLGFCDVVSHPPFAHETFRWRMGVRSTDASEWLQPDDLRESDLVAKAEVRLRHPDETFVAMDGSADAAAEVLELVDDDLRRRGLPSGPLRPHPLDTAGLRVQEDLCLMEHLAGMWIMTAASVCFPTEWDVPSKLGRSLGEIHAPVPAFDAHVGNKIDRFFDRMAAGSVASRLNWSLVGESSRRLDPRSRRVLERIPPDPGRELFVRVERQTLRRLTSHDAVIFGIRIHVWPLAEVAAALPAEPFAAELERLPIAVARYKNLAGVRGEVAAWLRAFTG